MSNNKTGVLEPEVKPQTESDDAERQRLSDIARTDQMEAADQEEEARQAQSDEQTPSATPPQQNDDEEQDSSLKDKYDDVKDVRDRLDKARNSKGSQEPSSSEPTNTPQDQGHLTGNQPQNAANTAGKAERAGAKAGTHAGEGAGGAAGETGAAGAETAGAGGTAATTAGAGATTAGTTAATTAGTAAGAAAAEGGAVAATEGVVTAAGAATSETGVGAVVAAAILAGIELGKELNRLRKEGLKRIFNYDKIAAKEGMKIGKIVGIVFIIIFSVLIFILVSGDPGSANEADAQNALTISNPGPTTATNGNLLNYTITVSYPGPFADIKITNRIPTGTQFVSSSDEVRCENGDCNESSRILYWYAKENGITTNPINTSFSLRLRAVNVTSNSKLINITTAVVIPPPTPTLTPTTPPPTEDTVTEPETP